MARPVDKVGSFIERSWYGDKLWCYALLPLALLFQSISVIRRWYWQNIQLPAPSTVPLIVVGNITVGGTGKTPLLISMANYFERQGFKVGVLSRGYGSRAANYPHFVDSATSVIESGDEALLIAQSTNCPVAISPKRVEARNALQKKYPCDVILSDDGMQHYALARHCEIVVIDGSRWLGNGLCLPAGPLRESAARLRSVDYVVVNGPVHESNNIPVDFVAMSLETMLWRKVVDDTEGCSETLSTIDRVHGISGIGNPARFFRSLREINIYAIEHVFADHHPYTLSDILFEDELPIVMTAKDAVKCKPLLQNSHLSDEQLNRYWYLPVEAQLPDAFYQQVLKSVGLVSNDASSDKDGTTNITKEAREGAKSV
jgi:tetraacyldisaccharide 4'-kinase